MLALTCSTASLGSCDSSSRMPGSVTPSRRCSGSAARAARRGTYVAKATAPSVGVAGGSFDISTCAAGKTHASMSTESITREEGKVEASEGAPNNANPDPNPNPNPNVP
eukprot:scaffold101267_cov45-Phaeocystis_antarctica.AAC.1